MTTAVTGTERAPESKPQSSTDTSAADPPAEQKPGKPEYIPDSLFNCWMALNNGHRELEHTIEMLNGIEAIVQKHAEGSGEELVVSECEATTILYLTRTTYHRLSELKDVLAKQVAVLLQLSNEKPTTGRSPARAPEQPSNELPATTVTLGDIRKQIKQVAALIEAACVCEWSHEDGGSATEGADYYRAVSGTIQAARMAVGKLLDRVDAKGGAE